MIAALTPLEEYIAGGFSLGVVLIVFFWGMTVLIRWLIRAIGL